MSDIFREVDDDLRREQLKRMWDRYGTYVIALAVLIVVVTAGWRFYEYWQDTRAQASGDRFVAALRLADDGKHAEAAAALDELVKDGSGGYPLLATFRSAAEKAAAGDDKGAVAAYDAAASASGAPALVRDLARLRAALLLVGTASLDDLKARIGDLADPNSGWRHSAREILGLVAYRNGDLAGARKYYEDIATDQQTPSDMRQRADFMLSVFDARLGVPPEAPTAEQPAAPAEPAKPAG
ncbi:MAG: tetratricopeptide repeat protein [Rhizobiales bacterium]|nr:tetratricopeptide repeat protein [Hyphomicrobiales bacterium]